MQVVKKRYLIKIKTRKLKRYFVSVTENHRSNHLSLEKIGDKNRDLEIKNMDLVGNNFSI